MFTGTILSAQTRIAPVSQKAYVAKGARPLTQLQTQLINNQQTPSKEFYSVPKTPYAQYFGANGKPYFTRFEEVKSKLTEINHYRGKALESIQVYINGYPFTTSGILYFSTVTHTIIYIDSLEETTLFPTKYGMLPVSGRSSFSESGQLTFVSPLGEDKIFRVGEYSIPFSITRPSGYLSKIFFHDSGEIEDIHLKGKVRLKVGGQHILFGNTKGGSADLAFYRTGKIQRGYLGEDTVLGGVKYPFGSFILFYENGSVKCVIWREVDFQGTLTIDNIVIGTKKGGGVMLDRKGKVLGARFLTHDATVKGVAFVAGDTFGNYPNREEPFLIHPGFILYNTRESDDVYNYQRRDRGDGIW